MTHRKVLLSCSPVLHSACMGPLSAVKKDSDVTWLTATVAATPAAVSRSIQERSRRCGFHVDDLTADGSYFPDVPDQALDLTVHIFNGAQAGFGRLRLAPVSAGTTVRIGVPPAGHGEDVANRIARLLADPALPCED